MTALTPKQEQGLADVRRRIAETGAPARDVLMDEQMSRRDRAAVAEVLCPGAGNDYR